MISKTDIFKDSLDLKCDDFPKISLLIAIIEVKEVVALFNILDKCN